MIELPEQQSQQRSLAFTLDEKVEKGTLITLMRGEEAILSFEAEKSFRTLILSSREFSVLSHLSPEKSAFSLYAGGSHTGEEQSGIYCGGEYIKGDASALRAGGVESFLISDTVSLFGGR